MHHPRSMESDSLGGRGVNLRMNIFNKLPPCTVNSFKVKNHCSQQRKAQDVLSQRLEYQRIILKNVSGSNV